MAKHKACRCQIRGVARKRPAAVFLVGVPDIGLILLDLAAKPDGVLAVIPGHLIANISGIANELGIIEGVDLEKAVHVEKFDATLRLGQLKDVDAEIVHLWDLSKLATIRRRSYNIEDHIVYKPGTYNPGVTDGVVLGLHGRACAHSENVLSIKRWRVHKAIEVKPGVKPILAPYRLVHTRNILVEVLLVGSREGYTAVRRCLRYRKKLCKAGCHRTDFIRWNDVASEWRARGRIVNEHDFMQRVRRTVCIQVSREVSIQVRCRRNHSVAGVVLRSQPRSLVSEENECAVFADWATNRASKLIPLQRIHLRCEIIPCIEGSIADELERIAVPLVRARLRYDIDHGAGIRAVLCVEAVGLDAKFLHRIRERERVVGIAHQVLVVGPVQVVT